MVAEGKSPTVDKLDAGDQEIETQILSMEMQAADKDGNKEVALSTSKIVSLLLTAVSLAWTQS